jgi:hypothetical protein
VLVREVEEAYRIGGQACVETQEEARALNRQTVALERLAERRLVIVR